MIDISETWLNDSSLSVDIDGYSFVDKSRENSSGGGVGLYISSNLNFKFRYDLDFSEPNVADSLFIEIVKPQGKSIAASVIYWPQTTTTTTTFITYNTSYSMYFF